MRRSILVTGSSGLIGSEVARHFDRSGWAVHGVDNNQRAVFFGPAGDTRWNQERLVTSLRSFTHHELDIRDRAGVLRRIEHDYPGWTPRIGLGETFDQIVDAWQRRRAGEASRSAA